MNHAFAERLALERIRDHRRRAGTDARLRAAGCSLFHLGLPRLRRIVRPATAPRRDRACAATPACSCG